MKRINFLPVEPKRKQSKDPLLLIALVTMLVVLIGLGTIQYKELTKNKKQVESLEQELSALQRDLTVQKAELVGVEKKQKSERAIIRAKDTRFRWAELLKELSLLTPADIWLTDLDNTRDEDGSFRIQLTGEAKSQEHMASYFKSLEHSYYLKDITLKYSEKLLGTNPMVIRFQFDCPLPVGKGSNQE